MDMAQVAEDWRRRFEFEQRVRLQREAESLRQLDYIAQLEQRCRAAEQAAQSRQALDMKADMLAKVAASFSQSLPSSIDRNINVGCDEVIDVVSNRYRIVSLVEARAEVADALRDLLDIASDAEGLCNADGEVLQLAVKTNVLSVKGIILMGIWTVFKNVTDSGDGDIETLLPDSVASIEAMLAKYEDARSESDFDSDDMSEDGGADLKHAARDTSSNASPPTNGTVVAADARDQFLVDQRRKGVSYGEIKRLGGFQEAESTLRGRYRVLVKQKSDRVRKPEWNAKDKAILREAVRDTISSSPGLSLSKRIPWKRVGVRMVELGASYHFGPATCAKQWDRIKDLKT